MEAVPVQASTSVVKVLEILRGPEVLKDFEGAEITVEPGEAIDITAGHRYVFHTNGWIFGESLAVRGVAVESATANRLRTVREAAQSHASRAIQARADRAEVIVTGQVQSVREVPRVPGTPVSEHDPEWREAVVKVEDVDGGTRAKKKKPQEVVVRFAQSHDVRWAQAPKFVEGQRGLWMLGDSSEAHRDARRALNLPTDHYLAIAEDDFIAEDAAPAVRDRLRSARRVP